MNAERRKRRPPGGGSKENSPQKPARKRAGGKGARGDSPSAPGRRGGPRGAGGGAIWLYGRHAALAALANPDRRIAGIRATAAALEAHGEEIAKQARARGIDVETMAAQALDRLLGRDAVHQGLAVAAAPLDQPDVAELRPADDTALVVVLDQASDPRNVGAVIRAAAAFGAAAVVTTERGAPPETGLLAKAAVGCLETTPYVQATNLARALEALKANGFWTVGLDGAATTTLAAAPFDRPTALVLGAEGRGLRRLTAAACDVLVSIPMAPGVESLNVAAAAAIALYESRRLRNAEPV